MKRMRVLSLLIVCFVVILSGCIKNQPYVTTLNPSLTANIGTYDFTAVTVVPSTVDTQIHDTITGLTITGFSADQTAKNDKIILRINSYKGKTGTFSIVQSQASAQYLHSGIISTALGGIVSITHVNSNSLTGYFSFTTQDGIAVQNGTFNVGLP